MSTLHQPTQTINLATQYGEPELPWSRAVEALGLGAFGPGVVCFLGTVGADGRPHAAAVGATHVDNVLYFTSGPKAYKTKHLLADPHCTLSMRLEGLDVVFEAEAHRVTDDDVLDKVAQTYDTGGWPATADHDNKALAAPYSAQSAGPGPWYLFRLDVATATGVGTAKPHGASRWVF